MGQSSILAYLVERWEFLATIVGAALVKFLLTISEDPPDDETDQGRRQRAKRMWAGITSGLVVAWVGTPALISKVPWLEEVDETWVAVVLVLAGEHIMRRILAPGDLIDRILNRTIGRGGE